MHVDRFKTTFHEPSQLTIKALTTLFQSSQFHTIYFFLM